MTERGLVVDGRKYPLDCLVFATGFESCTPGYYNNEGKASAAMAKSHPYGHGPAAFIKLLADWRERGDFAGLELGGMKEDIGA